MENEVIKSLLEEKSKLEQEFTNLETQENNIRIGKERIRGAYIVVIDQLKKFGVIKDDNTATAESVEDKAESKTEDTKVEDTAPKEVKESKPKTTKKPAEKKEKVVAGLTPEEIEKINKVVPKQNMKDDNGNEIPEYLQTEYNK